MTSWSTWSTVALAGLVSLCWYTQTCAVVPPPAYVQSAKDGQGFLMTKLGKCFVVTPAHVISGTTKAEVVGAGEPPVRGEARLLAQDISADVAVMQVDGPLIERCGSDYLRGASDDSVSRQSHAVLSVLFKDGNMGRGVYEATVVDITSRYLQLAPARDSNPLVQGLSGGIVSIDDLPAGMLLGVTGASGQVLRYEPLMNTVLTLLSSATPAVPSSHAGNSNLTASNSGASLANWSSPPLRPEFATSNLLMSAGLELWKVDLTSGPASIDIRLGGRATHAVTYVELWRGSADANQLVKDYEILISLDRASWVSVGSGTFEPAAPNSSVAFAPRNARYVRLRVLSSFDRENKIAALARVVVR